MYKFFIGIDISKLTLDIAVINNGIFVDAFQVKNSTKGMVEMLKLVKSKYKCTRLNTFFCAEQMGIYGRFVELELSKKKYFFCMEVPLQIKLSLGIQRGKSDALDAQRIAGYACQNHAHLKLWKPPRPALETLKTLVSMRNRLIKAKVMITNFAKIETYYLPKDILAANTAFYQLSKSSIEADIINIERKMDEVITRDDKLNNLMALITSVPRIGKITAIQMILFTNEFNSITCPRKFASYCGVAPFPFNSGTSIKGRTKISSIANKEIKKLLHLAAIGFTGNSQTFLGRYYRRKIAEGKQKMIVINAIRNKLIHRVYSCVKNNKAFEDLK